MRSYVCTVTTSGGFGSGYGGAYRREVRYTSWHRAGSKANAADALRAYRAKYGRAGRAEIMPGSIYRIDD